ncbi:PIPO, partial [Potyvirus algeriaense]|uniref:PIPO n=1 Tax=Potyvirus algeriaense TaxID=515575 RepID=UPI000269ADA7
NLRRELTRTMARIKLVSKVASKIVLVRSYEKYCQIFDSERAERFRHNIRLFAKMLCERR